MDCPKCKKSNHKKNGKIDGRQRYKCLDCGYNYSVELKSTASPRSIKRQALQLYLEGLGLRSIGRILGVSHVSVQKWIEKYGSELKELRREKITEVKLYEMHTYIENKKITAESGLLLIDLGRNSPSAHLVAGEQQHDKDSGKS